MGMSGGVRDRLGNYTLCQSSRNKDISGCDRDKLLELHLEVHDTGNSWSSLCLAEHSDLRDGGMSTGSCTSHL